MAAVDGERLGSELLNVDKGIGFVWEDVGNRSKKFTVVVFEANWARVRIDLAQNAIRLSLAEFQELFIIVRLDIYFLDFGPSLLTKCVVLS